MPAWVIPAALAVLGALKGGLGQRAASKQADASRREQERVAMDRYDRESANSKADLKRRKDTNAFARAISKANGYTIPDSVFDMLDQQEFPEFPAFHAPVGAHMPSPWASAGIGAGTGLL